MDDATASKRCPRCEGVLPRSEFGLNRAMRDGLQVQCRPCRADLQREYRAKNPDRVRVLGRESMQRRRDRDPDGVREYQRRWLTENPDRTRAAKRAWVEANYDRVRELARETSRRWKAAHPEAVRAEDARRRSLLVKVESVDLRALWVSQCGVCAMCRHRIDESLDWPDPMSKSLDHIVPLARGGEHAQRNLQFVHLVENLRKGARLPA